MERITTEPGEAPDLIVVDGYNLREELPAIRTVKGREPLVFTPVLLLIGQREEIPFASELLEWTDDLLRVPIKKAELQLRVQQLLRARLYSQNATRQKREVQAREQNYRRLTESSPEAVLVYDGEKIVLANSRARQLFDVEEDGALQSRTLEFLIAEDSCVLIQNQIRAVLERDDPTIRSKDVVLRTEEEKEVHVEVRAAPTRYEGERMVQLTFRDVTERRIREKQLLILDRILQHDLRKDITSTRGWADLLDEGSDLERGTRRIRTASNHMLETLRAAGALQEALRKGEEIQLCPVEICPAVREAADIVQMRHDQAQVSLTSEVHPQTVVQANDLIGSVFENLIANAVRHNDQPTPEVEVGLRRFEDAVRVSVADNGPGIPDHRREKIFQEGVQHLESDGMGLGLTLVDLLVAHYEGDVQVCSNQPRGTCFAVSLRALPGNELG